MAAMAAVLFAVPLPAVADSARPSNYRSEVTSIEPFTEGVVAEVVGGDAFLQVRVERGVSVEVPGYEGEPYVRIDAEGIVEVNRNSPTYWVNEDRFGVRPVPEGASADAAPDWERVGSGGVYGWHDHRIHWMSPEPPPAVEPAAPAEIFDWVVPLIVDGSPVQILGTLEWLPNTGPIPWALLVAAAAGAVLVRSMLLLVGAVAATTVGFAQMADSPLGPGGELLSWAPPVAALLLSGAALRRKGRHLLLGATAAVLLAWVATRLGALWMPSLPTALPTWLERAATALAAGTGLGGVVAVYRETQRTAPGSAVQPGSGG